MSRMTKFKEYIRWLTAEQFADSMSLNCMGCPAYPCTTSTEDIPDTGDECYERLLAWCNEDDGTVVINDDMKQRLLDAAKLALYRDHEDGDFVDRTEVESGVLAGLVKLVEDHEPRVLDWDEIKDYSVVYCEIKGHWKIYPLIVDADDGEVKSWNPEINISKEFMLIVSDEDDRRNVRCWNCEPTEEQRQAVKWE